MRSTRLILCVVLSVCCSSSLAALSEQTVDKLIDISGLELQVSQMPAVLQAAGSQAAGQNLPQGTTIDLQRILGELLTAEGMFTLIRKRLRADFSEEEAATLFRWLESPLGRKLTIAEEEASTPAAMRDMQRRAAALMLSEQRVAYANEIMQLFDNEMMIEVEDKMYLEVFHTVSHVQAPNSKADDRSLRRLLDESRAQRLANMEDMIRLSLIYTYKKFDYNEIEAYIGYLKTPESMKLNRIVEESMRDEMSVGAERFAAALGEELEKLYGEQDSQQGI